MTQDRDKKSKEIQEKFGLDKKDADKIVDQIFQMLGLSTPSMEEKVEPVGEDVNSYIAHLLLQEKKRLREKIEGMKRDAKDVQKYNYDSFGNMTPSTIEKEYDHDDEIHNNALSDILSILE